ncbi:MFS transporter [Marinivivus vitaminiproducens]|uniref:MFS transporter n=1 Tax=Marinivivus vitaminiproducens TaxID=3035935 RepID=UPI0027A9E724|nr:MFS transporter [Geminicoccaceae bacterium SCSIO 64248]
MPRPAWLGLRLSLFYAGYFGMTGVFLPFWPVWLAGRGLDAWTISAAIALGMAARVALAPVIARAADRSGRRRRIMIVSAALALAGQASFFAIDGAPAILAVSLLTGAALSAIMPLGDAVAMRHVGAGHVAYGPVRLWGSIAFVATSLLTGAMIAAFGSETVLGLVVASTALILAACLLMPAGDGGGTGRSRGGGWRTFLRRDVLIVLPAAGLIQASHAVYYGFGSLNWQHEGLGDVAIGTLWALGVVAEIILFALAAGLLRRLAPLRLLHIAALLATLRWLLMAGTSALPLLALGQALHAVSFGVTHLAVLHWLHARIPAHLAGTGQAIYNAFGNGIMLTLATLAAGPLYASLGGYAYGAMAVLSTAGGLLLLGIGHQAREREPATRPAGRATGG